MNTLDDFGEEAFQKTKFNWLWKGERILWGTGIVGLIFKFMHWPGAGLILVVSLTFLAMLYFISVAVPIVESPKQKISQVIMAFSLAILMVAMLFGIQNYPGAKVMLNTGSVLGAIGLVLFALFGKTIVFWKNKFTARVIVLSVITFLMNSSLIFPKIIVSAYADSPSGSYASVAVYTNGTCRFSNEVETVRGDCEVDGTKVTGLFNADFNAREVLVEYNDTVILMTATGPIN